MITVTVSPGILVRNTVHPGKREGVRGKENIVMEEKVTTRLIIDVNLQGTMIHEYHSIVPLIFFRFCSHQNTVGGANVQVFFIIRIPIILMDQSL